MRTLTSIESLWGRLLHELLPRERKRIVYHDTFSVAQPAWEGVILEALPSVSSGDPGMVYNSKTMKIY